MYLRKAWTELVIMVSMERSKNEAISYGRNAKNLLIEEGMNAGKIHVNRSRCVTTNVTLGVYMFPGLWLVRLPVGFLLVGPSKTESSSQHFFLKLLVHL